MQTLSAPAFTRQRFTLSLWRLMWLVLVAGCLSACAGVKLVDAYDADAVKGITDTSADVFAFYDRLIEAKAKAKASASKLPYAASADDWGKIETRIRVLAVREASRPLNSESERILSITLEFWQKRRAEHRASDDYAASLVAIHRDHFQRLFTAAMVAEKAKALAVEDGGTPKK